MESKMKKENVIKKTAEAKLRSVKVSPTKLSALARSIKGMYVNKVSMALAF